ncbi:MAG: hypothetical protein GY861_12590 [bacterium]|nr:hypothetical protein [bacterium]
MGLTKGPVLELGCGDGSTLLLHSMCGVAGRKLISFESNETWMNEFASLRRDWHEIRLVDKWLGLPEYKLNWGLVFVDHPIARFRGRTIDKYNNADIIVAHDSHRECNCRYTARFEKYKYRYDYKKLKPWTTAISNKINLDVLEEMDL